MSDEPKDEYDALHKAIEEAESARANLKNAEAADKEEDLGGYLCDSKVRRMLYDEMQKQWKQLMAPVIEKLKEELVQKERVRNELVRQTARKL